MHVLHTDGARRGPRAERHLRELLGLGNECVEDVIDQHPEGMSTPLIGLYLAISNQSAGKLVRFLESKHAEKLAELLGETGKRSR